MRGSGAAGGGAAGAAAGAAAAASVGMRFCGVAVAAGAGKPGGAPGHMPLSWDHLASLAWQPQAWWTRKVCYRYLFPNGPPAIEAGAGAVSCLATDGGDRGDTVGDNSSSSCGGVAGGGCGCWRGFLLQDVGVVELMGVALRELVPAPPLLPPLGGSTEGRDQVVVGVADACVLLAAAFPEEVARAAGALVNGSAAAAAARFHNGGSGGSCARPNRSRESSSSDGDIGTSASACASASVTVWSPCGLAHLAQLVSQLGESEVMVRALRLLEEWCGACGVRGGPVGFDEEQRAVLRARRPSP